MRPRSYVFVVKLVHLLLRMFFRRVEVAGLDNVPTDGGGVLVSWHPNGMIDPALIFETFPRKVVFGARHGLFRIPVLGWIMRSVGTVPIFRAQDAGQRADPAARRLANQRSLDALAEQLVKGSFTCLFPEGDSHDAPHLLALKTGVARFYYRARQLSDGPPPRIVPVGLHYDAKRIFRSNVLVTFHPPIELPEALDVTPSEDEPEDTRRARWRSLTDVVESTLREAVHATESWEVHHLMHRARKLLRAERSHRAGSQLDKPTMAERTRAFARIWTGYEVRRKTHPEEVAAFEARIRDYDADLRALRMEDHELDRGPPIVNLWLALLLLLQVLLVYLFLPPLLIVGYVVNGPPAGVLWLLARWAAKKQKDEASIKVLAGAVLFPMTWLGVGLLAGWTHVRMHALFPAIPDNFVLGGFTAALLAFVGGAVALRYLRLARETMRAVQVRLTRERRRLTVARLRVDREELTDTLTSLGEGLDLPGSVGDDGRVRRSLTPGAT
ncbi:MAG: 1-acyl-sn-glycerol-3-phosphate acyltransferase [Sandaracinaceae bacterium]